MFGGIVNNVGDGPGSSDCDISNCFCDELGAASLFWTCVVADCEQVACDQLIFFIVLRTIHQNPSFNLVRFYRRPGGVSIILLVIPKLTTELNSVQRWIAILGWLPGTVIIGWNQ